MMNILNRIQICLTLKKEKLKVTCQTVAHLEEEIQFKGIYAIIEVLIVQAAWKMHLFITFYIF